MKATDLVTVLAEHRATAQLVTHDVDALEPLGAILTDLVAAAHDHDLDTTAARLAALLSVLAASHPLVVAARAGVEVGDLRRQRARIRVETSHAIAAGWPKGYAHTHAPFAELQHRRYGPDWRTITRRPA